MNEEQETKSMKPVDTPPQEYYGDPASIYVRLTYSPEQGGFRFEIRNELIRQFTVDDLPDYVKSMSAFVRGMCEVAMKYPHDMFSVGSDAMNREYIRDAEGLTEAQKIALLNPVGEA